MRLPGLTSLVLELPWAGGTATSSATQCPAGKDPWWVHPAPQDPPKAPTALEENTASPCASGQELILACHSREELPLPGMFPTVHSSLLPLTKHFPWAERQAQGLKPKSAAVGLKSCCLLAGVVLSPTRE